MRMFFTLCLIASLIACSKEKEKSNEVLLFNNIVFALQKGEVVEPIDEPVKNKYFKYLGNQNIQIPLFRYIKHTNYEIFIGLPFNTSIKDIVDSQLNKTEAKDTSSLFQNSPSAFYKKNNKDDVYITAYASEIDKKSLIYITAITASKALSDSLFNQNELSKRIVIKNGN